MRIKQLSFIVCAAIVGLFVLISYVTSELVVVRGVDAIESNSSAEKMKQLRNHIHAQETQLSHIAVDWACWDDAYRFMQDNNDDFVRTNLRQQMLAKLNLSSIAYVSRDAVNVHMVEDDAGWRKPGHTAEVQRLYGQLANRLEGSSEEGLAGIMMIGSVPHLVAAQKSAIRPCCCPPTAWFL